MFKNFCLFNLGYKILLSILYYVCFSLAIPFGASAHEVSYQQWIFVDGSDVIEINPSPNPSKLDSAEHILREPLRVGQFVQLSINLDALKVSVSKEDVVITWINELSNGLGTGLSFETSFGESGVHAIAVLIKNTNDDKAVHISERILFTVGEPILPAEFTVNKVEPKGLLNINRAEELIFEVERGDTDTYTYVWDLADFDTVEGLFASKYFKNTRMPAYVVLRKTDKKSGVYIDSSVRLESTDPPEVKIARPPANTQTEDVRTVLPSMPTEKIQLTSTKPNWLLIAGIALLSAGLLIVLFKVLFLRKRI